MGTFNLIKVDGFSALVYAEHMQIIESNVCLLDKNYKLVCKIPANEINYLYRLVENEND